MSKSQFPWGLTDQGAGTLKGAFQGCICRGRGLRTGQQSALTIGHQWSDQHHLDCFKYSWSLVPGSVFSPFFFFFFGGGDVQFSEFWQLMPWVQSGHYIVNVFHLVGVSVSIKTACRIWLRILSIAFEEEIKVLDLAYWLVK